MTTKKFHEPDFADVPNAPQEWARGGLAGDCPNDWMELLVEDPTIERWTNHPGQWLNGQQQHMLNKVGALFRVEDLWLEIPMKAITYFTGYSPPTARKFLSQLAEMDLILVEDNFVDSRQKANLFRLAGGKSQFAPVYGSPPAKDPVITHKNLVIERQAEAHERDKAHAEECMAELKSLLQRARTGAPVPEEDLPKEFSWEEEENTYKNTYISSTTPPRKKFSGEVAVRPEVGADLPCPDGLACHANNRLHVQELLSANPWLWQALRPEQREQKISTAMYMYAGTPGKIDARIKEVLEIGDSSKPEPASPQGRLDRSGLTR